MKYKLKKIIVADMYKKTYPKTTYILAVQMLIFISSCYYITLTLNINQQYMHMLRFNIVRCVFLLIYVLMKYYLRCVNIVM